MRTLWGAALGAYALIVVGGTLAPFRFALPPYFTYTRTPAPQWDPQDGMVFSGVGMYTAVANKDVNLRAIADAGVYYVYLEFRPDTVERPLYPTPLLAMAPKGLEYGWRLAQDGPDLLVYVPTRMGPRYRIDRQRMRFPNLIRPGVWHGLLLADGGGQVRVWMDGTPVAARAREPLQGAFWDHGNFVAAGNELLGRFGWRGRLRHVEIGSGPPPVRLLADGAAGAAADTSAGTPLLLVSAAAAAPPQSWGSRSGDIWHRTPPRPWRLQPLRPLRRNDAAVNFLVFVPFGYLALVRWRSMLRVVAAGMALSLVVEAAQILLPVRVSDISDVLMNATGTLAGAAVAVVLARRGTAPPTDPASVP